MHGFSFRYMWYWNFVIKQLLKKCCNNLFSFVDLIRHRWLILGLTCNSHVYGQNNAKRLNKREKKNDLNLDCSLILLENFRIHILPSLNGGKWPKKMFSVRIKWIIMRKIQIDGSRNLKLNNLLRTNMSIKPYKNFHLWFLIYTWRNWGSVLLFHHTGKKRRAGMGSHIFPLLSQFCFLYAIWNAEGLVMHYLGWFLFTILGGQVHGSHSLFLL